MNATTTPATRTYALSVCGDCLMAAHGVLEESDPAYLTALSRITEGRVIPACVSCETCDAPDCRSAACDCGEHGGATGHGFTDWSTCDGCGDTLAGDRYGITVEA